MTRQLREQFEGAIYHVMAKGNQGDFIFNERPNKEYFLGCLEQGSQRFNVDLFAFCIMGNHYHLLMRTNEANLSSLMHYVGTSYASHLRAQDRIGHIFSGRFKSILVDSEQYILYVSRYIHLNPQRAGMVRHPGEYPWSSYRSYMNERHRLEWVNSGFVLDQFGSSTAAARKGYKSFMGDPGAAGHDYPKYPDSIPLAKVVFGGDRYSWAVLSGLGNTGSQGKLPTDRNGGYLPLRSLYTNTCRIFQLDELEDDASKPTTIDQATSLFVFAAREYLMSTNQEIGWLLHGISPCAVSRRYKRALSLLEGTSPEVADLHQALDEMMENIWP